MSYPAAATRSAEKPHAASSSEKPFRKELTLDRKKVSENSEGHSFLATRCRNVATAIFLSNTRTPGSHPGLGTALADRQTLKMCETVGSISKSSTCMCPIPHRFSWSFTGTTCSREKSSIHLTAAFSRMHSWWSKWKAWPSPLLFP